MRVLEEKNAFMSDYETLQFLISLQNQHRWTSGSKSDRKHNKPYYHPELQTITRDTVRYITQRSTTAEDPEEPETSDKTVPNNANKSTLLNLTTDQFSTLMQELNAFPLYKAEKLQIVNQLPTNLVHLYSIVEECESRLDEGQVTSLLECISRTCL
ncbi:DNA-directed RNA polymerase III subunit RPC17 [Kluyveromyces lactis]|uniref:DNA-directed RNA polymerase III subunit RPC9 n=1 Tax=Kluyveromyces lactis (strain ATCC 8585 / CBS 2359 / DSM 70799 / NBRC 1267 / NRRL Y-1140 / WM37) TaxID=284590 RepID=Q6CIZ7_KLULA|nr:uncharacterized protein KLLA0_F22649g [Kluyveromyces lactis]CAG98800.1 KLLA0F22649p [Kluyveromyces lactis]|eukprot:XP_456092.1 uncharacterized protein KLLA0_F22649g [Kluyveromyces lactis]